MKIDVKRYRLAHLPCDELGVLAAFLGIPCLYGIPGSWIKKGGGRLEGHVLRLARQLEEKGAILAEPGGIVQMEPLLYGLVTDMGGASRLGRLSWGSKSGLKGLYFYRAKDGVVTAGQDGRGGAYLGRIPSAKAWRDILDAEKESAGAPAVARTKDWLGALVFENREGFWERVFDLAWTDGQERGLAAGGGQRA